MWCALVLKIHVALCEVLAMQPLLHGYDELDEDDVVEERRDADIEDDEPELVRWWCTW